MKKDKLSLKGIKNVLSRDEMKMIMAGSGSGGPGGSGGCGQGCYLNAGPLGCPNCGTCVSLFGTNAGTCQ
ncbi:MAG TPA: hypothetical protein VHB54_01180 [Mucilaginibacter sp.]|nr:hypothetical protein [Mucilaginibacter sp.]